MKLEEPRDRDRFLTDFELRLFFKVIANMDSIMCEPIFLILYTGVRRAEAFGARWSEFEQLDKGYWIIPGSRTKNGVEHLIPLPAVMQTMMEEVAARSKERGLVWPTAACADEVVERPMSGYSHFVDRLNEQMQALAKDYGRILRHFTIHDLRRTLVTGMRGLLDEDDNPLIDSNVVERCINHVIGGVAGVYNRHGYLKEKKAAFRKWADHLNQLSTEACSSQHAVEDGESISCGALA